METMKAASNNKNASDVAAAVLGLTAAFMTAGIGFSSLVATEGGSSEGELAVDSEIVSEVDGCDGLDESSATASGKLTRTFRKLTHAPKKSKLKHVKGLTAADIGEPQQMKDAPPLEDRLGTLIMTPVTDPSTLPRRPRPLSLHEFADWDSEIIPQSVRQLHSLDAARTSLRLPEVPEASSSPPCAPRGQSTSGESLGTMRRQLRQSASSRASSPRFSPHYSSTLRRGPSPLSNGEPFRSSTLRRGPSPASSNGEPFQRFSMPYTSTLRRGSRLSASSFAVSDTLAPSWDAPSDTGTLQRAVSHWTIPPPNEDLQLPPGFRAVSNWSLVSSNSPSSSAETLVFPLASPATPRAALGLPSRQVPFPSRHHDARHLQGLSLGALQPPCATVTEL